VVILPVMGIAAVIIELALEALSFVVMASGIM
jgi:hypothetical protein